jgi:hypothetical protein
VPPVQVAEWAGHSVAVLLRIYAKCIDGQDQLNKRRIDDALNGYSRREPDTSSTETDENELEQPDSRD